MSSDMYSDRGGQGSAEAGRKGAGGSSRGGGNWQDQVRGQASAGMDQISSGAWNLTGKARERAYGFVDGQKQTLTEGLDSVAQAIREAGNELGGDDQAVASRLAEQAANGIESLSRSIQDAELSDVVDAVRSYGRSNPALLIGTAVFAGLALGRFVRASSHREAGYGRSWDRGSGAGGYRPGDGGSRSYGGYPDAGDRSSFSSRQSGSSGGAGFSAGAGVAAGAGFASGAPQASQGYAGGGMGRDPIQSSTPSSTRFGPAATPSSETDPSVGGSSVSGGGMPSGAISTGENS